MTRLDELMQMAERVDQLRRLAFPKLFYILSVIAVIIPATLTLDGRAGLLLLPFGFWYVVQYPRYKQAMDHYVTEMGEELCRVPIEKRQAAVTLYGWDSHPELAALECEDAHMLGDCPLCGAV